MLPRGMRVRAKSGVPDPSGPDQREEFVEPAYRLVHRTEGVLVVGSRGAVLIPWGNVKHARYTLEEVLGLTTAPVLTTESRLVTEPATGASVPQVEGAVKPRTPRPGQQPQS